MFAGGCDIPPRPPLPPGRAAGASRGDDALVRRVEATIDRQTFDPPPVGLPAGLNQTFELASVSLSGSTPVGDVTVRSFVGDDGATRQTLKERLWVRRGNASLLRRSAITETVRDGRLRSVVADVDVGPLRYRFDVRPVEASDSDPGPSRRWTVVTTDPRTGKTVGRSETIDWDPSRDRGPLAPWTTAYRATDFEPGALKTFSGLLIDSVASDPDVPPSPLDPLVVRQVRMEAMRQRPLRVLTGEGAAELSELSLAVRRDGLSIPMGGFMIEPASKNVRRYIHPGGLIGRRIGSGDASPLTPPPGGAALYVSGRGFDPAATAAVAMSGGDFVEAARLAEGPIPDDAPEPPDEPILRPAPGQLTEVRPTPGGNQFVLVLKRPTFTLNRNLSVFASSSGGVDIRPTDLADYRDELVRRLSTVILARGSVDDRITAVSDAIRSTVAIDESFDGDLRASTTVRESTTDRLGLAVVTAAVLRGKRIPARLALGVRRIVDAPEGGNERSESDGSVSVAVYRFDAWTIAESDGGVWRVVDPGVEDAAAPDRITLAITDVSAEKLRGGIAETLDAMTRLSLLSRRVWPSDG